MHNYNYSSNLNEKEPPYLVPTPEWPEELVEPYSQTVDNVLFYNHGYPVFHNNMPSDGYSNDETFIQAPNDKNIFAEEPTLQNLLNNEAEEAKMRRTESNRISKAYEREHNKSIVETYIDNDKLYEEIKHEYLGCPDYKKLCEKFIKNYKRLPKKPRRVSGKISKKPSIKDNSLNSDSRMQASALHRFLSMEPQERFVEHPLYHQNDTYEHPSFIPHCARFIINPDGSWGDDDFDEKAYKYQQKLKLYEQYKQKMPALVPDEKIEEWHEYNDQLIKQLHEKFEKDNDENYFWLNLFSYFAPFEVKCHL